MTGRTHEVCWEHEISETLDDSWRDKLLEGGGAALAGSQVRPATHGRRRATQREQVRPQVDSVAESKLAADPNPNNPAGQHRI